MSTEDLSRSAWYPTKRYAGVRMQQGRVLTDDDFNEAQVAASEALRRVLLDVVGPTGSPDEGFKVSSPSRSGTEMAFTLGAGDLFVGGVHLRLPEAVGFGAQPDWLRQRTLDRTGPAAAGTSLVYLEVWQQPVTAVEDAELFELALGGSDTSTRLRTMWRVRQATVTSTDCADAWAELTNALEADLRGEWSSANCVLQNDLRLRVTYTTASAPEDLCAPSTVAGYLGANNAAIRVQLVEPAGASPAALTWGFDNASPLYRVEIDSTGLVTFGTEPKDQAHWPLLGQTVEILPWSAILDPNRELVAEGHGRADPLSSTDPERVSTGNGFLTTLTASYNPTTRQARLASALPAGFNTLATGHAGANVDKDGVSRSYVYLRVWDRGSDYTSPARIEFNPTTDTVTLGNTGIVVQVQGTHLRADAHWIIAARPESPDEVVPWQLEHPNGHPPQGVATAICPLALIHWGATDASNTVQDCRATFRPLTRIKDCCNVTVGDGERSFGDYTSIQEAVDSLPSGGGHICLLEGEYNERVEIRGRSNVTISGCGERSKIANPGTDGDAAIYILDSDRVTLEGFAIAAEAGWGVMVEAVDEEVSEIRLRELVIEARDYGAVVMDTADPARLHNIEISDNRFTANELGADPTAESVVGRLPLLWLRGETISVRRNKIRAPQTSNPVRRGMGGLQLAGGCRDVRVRENQIDGGNGNGITLGSIREESETGIRMWLKPYFGFYFYFEGGCLRIGSWWSWQLGLGATVEITLVAEDALTDIGIVGNRVQDMAGDGIGVAWFFDEALDEAGAPTGLPSDFITVEDLRIHDNHLERNCTGEFVPISDFVEATSLHGGVSLADVDRLDMRGGRIVNHGGTRDTSLAAVFAQVASGARIYALRAHGNGASNDTPVPGNAGGIVLKWATPTVNDADGWNGAPAASIHDCLVDAPQGHPLYVLADGPLSIQANQLSGRLGADSTTGFAGTGVWLGSFGGFSEDFYGYTADPPTSPEDAGNISFLGNIVSLRAPEGGSRLLFFVHLFGGAGDAQVHKNLFRTELGASSFALAHVYGTATTGAATGNRLEETMNRCNVSFGLRGSTAGELYRNMGTHCFVEDDPVNGITTGERNRSLRGDWVTATSNGEEDACAAILEGWSTYVSGVDAVLEELFPQLVQEETVDRTYTFSYEFGSMSSYVLAAERRN